MFDLWQEATNSLPPPLQKITLKKNVKERLQRSLLIMRVLLICALVEKNFRSQLSQTKNDCPE